MQAVKRGGSDSFLGPSLYCFCSVRLCFPAKRRKEEGPIEGERPLQNGFPGMEPAIHPDKMAA